MVAVEAGGDMGTEQIGDVESPGGDMGTEQIGDVESHGVISAELNEVSGKIIGAAIEVHRCLGPGLLESIYERALGHELQLQGMVVRRQVPIFVQYKDIAIDGQRLDMLVEPGIILEIKAVSKLIAIHNAQLLSYLKSTGHRLGLLINFNMETLTSGIKRIVN